MDDLTILDKSRKNVFSKFEHTIVKISRRYTNGNYSITIQTQNSRVRPLLTRLSNVKSPLKITIKRESKNIDDFFGVIELKSDNHITQGIRRIMIKIKRVR